jgi:retron-type reverse transcriptase
MKRWNASTMLERGQKLFASIHKRKAQAHHNHEIHFLARELQDWLPEGVQAMIEGSYTPRHIKRIVFKEERIDQLYPADRVLQHLFLKELKPTFAYVMSPNCYHLSGPMGVKRATQRIRHILQNKKPAYVIRADIRSFYKSITHRQLIEDVHQAYDDSKVRMMLTQIITNPIETPKGYSNPGYGIALRGPLSQFFSALYLKPLDEAFDNTEVDYLRYQDDSAPRTQAKAV